MSAQILPFPSMVDESDLVTFAKRGAPPPQPDWQEWEALEVMQPLTFALMRIEKLLVAQEIIGMSDSNLKAELFRVSREARLLTHAVNPLIAGLDHA